MEVETEEPWSRLADDLFQRPVMKVTMTRKQKREQQKSYGLERAKDQPRSKQQPSTKGLDISAEELCQMQGSDTTLDGAAERMGFFKRSGILYRRWVPRGQTEEAGVDQIVLPRECRRTALQLAHTIPLGAHLGEKRAEQIMKRFYWPTLYRDVADFCRSCAECQKAGYRRVTRVPMVPLPVIGEPFHRITMDIVGPLPRSRAGHRYVLTICDYATRCPEAVTTKTIDA